MKSTIESLKALKPTEAGNVGISPEAAMKQMLATNHDRAIALYTEVVKQ
jgi:hypothetical protein